MTYKEKDFLLKDLCARLPYGVTLMNIYGEKRILKTINYEFGVFEVENEDSPGNYEQASILTWKPCLRPLSSMTEEEKEELEQEFCIDVREEDNGRHTEEYGYVIVYHNFNNETWYIPYEAIDWLNEHHFDYRGLIDKGLAIEELK